jgi:hypothetical protein
VEYLDKNKQKNMTEEKLEKLENKISDLSIKDGDGKDQHDYKKSKEYWENIPASINGMLGGFGNITTTG